MANSEERSERKMSITHPSEQSNSKMHMIVDFKPEDILKTEISPHDKINSQQHSKQLSPVPNQIQTQSSVLKKQSPIAI